MTGTVKVKPGAIVRIDGDDEHMVMRYEGLGHVVVRDLETSVVRVVPIESLRSAQVGWRHERTDLIALGERRLEAAHAKYQVIKPLVGTSHRRSQEVRNAADSAGVSVATVYRWIKDFSQGEGGVAELARKQRSDFGRSKLPLEVEKIVEEVIEQHWLKPERPTIAKTHRELKRRCWEASPRLKAPSVPTLIERIQRVDLQYATKRREGAAAARKFNPVTGSIPLADVPYGMLQIDHTRVDLHLVDETNRVPIGRPWITVAIDVYSRMIAGYYVSFDSPGTLATGLCIANAILSKKTMLARHGLSYDYPCMGKPHVIHVDNANEFHGKTLELACKLYGIDLVFRKKKQPEYGAHIERYMGTLAKELHTLPGTSQSNAQQRGDYDSSGRAIMTLSEFDRWLANLVAGYYHNEVHSALGCSPLVKYTKGVLGDATTPGSGVTEIAGDPERLRIEFLPMFEATVQTYGIKIDHINYQSDVLRRWIGAKQKGSLRRARKFVCRRDPRDISHILFYDPVACTYFRIPYRNLSNPRLSLWELREVTRRLRLQGRQSVDEATIFGALGEMRRIEGEAAEKTRAARRSGVEVRRLRRRDSPQPDSPQQSINDFADAAAASVAAQTAGTARVPPPDLLPFDEIEPA